MEFFEYGLQIFLSPAEKIVTTGTLKAAAICCAEVSIQATKDACFTKEKNSCKDSSPAKFKEGFFISD